jgi:hypothetical protein
MASTAGYKDDRAIQSLPAKEYEVTGFGYAICATLRPLISPEAGR